MKTTAFILIIALALLAVIENTLILNVRHETIRSGGLKIAHIGDIHKRKFGRDNSRICRRIAAEKPDIILISGDLVSRTCSDFTLAGDFVRQLVKIAPVFMVMGNHENDLPGEYSQELVKILSYAGVRLLRNSSECVETGGRRLCICGLELESGVYKKNGSYRSLDVPELDEIRQKLGDKPSEETVLLVHSPFFAELYAQWGADFAVCGHVHGGSVKIPFTNIGILSPERKFFPKYSKGVYQVGGMKLLLTSGIGKLRLFNAPEIVIYTL